MEDITGTQLNSLKTKKNVALFDFDKTLTTKDTFILFFIKNILSFKITLQMGYYIIRNINRISIENIKLQFLKYGLQNRSLADLQKLGQDFNSKYINQIINPSVFKILKSHQSNDDEIWIVSASLRFWLEPWCKLHNVNLICTELEVKNGLLTGNLESLHCYKEAKAQMVKARIQLPQYLKIFVYGNLPQDHDFLSLASNETCRFNIL